MSAATPQKASGALGRTREQLLTAVRIHSSALEDASDELRRDREIVLAAVEQDGGALEFASKELQQDREIVLAAVKQSGMPCRLLAAPGVSTPAIRVVVGKPRRGPRLPSILVCGDVEANPGPRGMSGARQRANESTGRTPQSTGSLTSVRKRGLRVSTLNVAGVKEGISEIVNEMEDRSIDLCVICETRTKPREMQRVLTRSGAMYVVSFSGETCAGIGLIYREALGSGKDPRGWHVEGVEFYTRTITGFIGGPDGSRIKFIGAYAPQKRNTVERDLFFEQLGRLVPPSVGCLLLGDLNLQCSASAQLSMREQRLRTRFLQEMAARDLRDLASGSNRRSSWTWAGKSGVVAGRRARLDYIFARLPRSEVRRFRVMNVALPTDHRLVTADLEIPTAVQSNGRKYRVRAVLAGPAREKAFPVVASPQETEWGSIRKEIEQLRSAPTTTRREPYVSDKTWELIERKRQMQRHAGGKHGYLRMEAWRQLRDEVRSATHADRAAWLVRQTTEIDSLLDKGQIPEAYKMLTL